MKFSIVFFTLFFSKNIIAQIPYTDFVQNDTAIQWAAEYDQILNITPKITRYGIRNIIHSKLMKGACIDNYTVNGDGAFKSSFCLKDTGLTKETFNTNFNAYYFLVNYNEFDSKGFAQSEMPGSYDLNIKKNQYHIYKVKQIITYRNYALSVQNILVSPIFLKNISNLSSPDKFTWYSTYTSSFNNKNEKITAVQKKKCIDLGNVEEKYDFSFSQYDTSSRAKIFTKFNPILSKHLYEDILAKKITAVDMFNNYIPSEKIFEINNPEIEVNRYDDYGNIKTVLKLRNEVNMDSLYNFSINQHFYYDSSKNILYSEVNYININRRVFTSEGLDLGIGFHFRIYFIKPSLYKKRPQKKYLN